jgi:SET domain-containing protein
VIDPIELVRLDWVSVRPSRIHGFGLFAQAFIPAEGHIGDYAGPLVQEDGRYVLWVEEDDGSWSGVDGRNVLRYMNHSSSPNAELYGVELYALRDIERGEEITIHYGEDWAEGNPEDGPDSVVAA